MSVLMPLLALLFLALMGWVLLRLIGSPDAPETFNPNSCCSRRAKQGAAATSEREAAADPSPAIRRFPEASARHRLHGPPSPR